MKTVVTLLVGIWLGRQFYKSHCDCKQKRKNKHQAKQANEQHQSR